MQSRKEYSLSKKNRKIADPIFLPYFYMAFLGIKTDRDSKKKSYVSPYRQKFWTKWELENDNRTY